MTALQRSDRKDLLTFDQTKIALIKATVAKDATDSELQLFMHLCQRTGLDPFARQIYFQKRYTKRGGSQMTVLTGIDGYRLIADRTGLYAGNDDPIFDDEAAPRKAVVTVYKLIGGMRCPFTSSARWDQYYPGDDQGFMWRKMPHLMLGKCFSPETEVLTTKGFERFESVTGQVLQVADGGLEPTDAQPFVQDYAGPMVVQDGDMLNFCVTPNHDMITTLGKVEAGAMLATARTRPVWHIPMVQKGSRQDLNIADDDLRLAGYIAADGHFNGYRQFIVSVSKQRKMDALRTLNPIAERVVHSKGAVAANDVREIRSNFDKISFTFSTERVHKVLGTDKVLVTDTLSKLSCRQARILFDAWQEFDGYTNLKTGGKRIYTSRIDHIQAIELLAVAAGYSVNTRKERVSDISAKPNYRLTISEPSAAPVVLPHADRPGIRRIAENPTGKVWCVTVPSGKIVVRRNGFSMLCGNCAEALALRKAFPAELSGLYTVEEMEQADRTAPLPEPRSEREPSKVLTIEPKASKNPFLTEPDIERYSGSVPHCKIVRELARTHGITELEDLKALGKALLGPPAVEMDHIANAVAQWCKGARTK